MGANTTMIAYFSWGNGVGTEEQEQNFLSKEVWRRDRSWGQKKNRQNNQLEDSWGQATPHHLPKHSVLPRPPPLRPSLGLFPKDDQHPLSWMLQDI